MSTGTAEDPRGWLRLLGCGLEKSRLTALVGALGSPGAVMDASDSELAETHGLGTRHIQALRQQPTPADIDRQMIALERSGARIVPVASPDFPRNLFHLRVPPPAIFVKGRLESYDSLAVGIVGPRTPTAYGLSVARALARDFAPTLTIVSGAALGIDSAAHEAVLDAGGRTIGVLGCGIDINYPSTNAKLRARIGDGGQGALVSIFPPLSPPHSHHFPIRNHILAGLSLAVVVVEAGARSGALVTARAAGEEGRQVYAVPGDITRANSAGSNALLRDGAAVCTGAASVIEDLEGTLHRELEELLRRRRAAPGAAPTEEHAVSNAGRSPGEEAILRMVAHSSISHDDLIAKLVPGSMSLGELSSALLMLELDGRIRQSPGRLYDARL